MVTKSKNKQIAFYDESKVYFKKLKTEEIEYYLNNYSPYDKAGGYGVQDWIGYIGIDKIEGSFYTVMGLPVKELYEELMKFWSKLQKHLSNIHFDVFSMQ